MIWTKTLKLLFPVITQTSLLKIYCRKNRIVFYERNEKMFFLVFYTMKVSVFQVEYTKRVNREGISHFMKLNAVQHRFYVWKNEKTKSYKFPKTSKFIKTGSLLSLHLRTMNKRRGPRGFEIEEFNIMCIYVSYSFSHFPVVNWVNRWSMQYEIKSNIKHFSQAYISERI